MKLSYIKLIGIILIIALPLFVWVIKKTTHDRSQANILPIGSVRINPEVVQADINQPDTNLSALAYDTGGLPIWSGVTYQWGISTTNSIGTLSINRDDKLAAFTPSRTNRGRGDIFVTAFMGTTQVTKSIPVYIGVSPTPTPTQPPQYDYALDIIVRFAGVTDGKASGAKTTIRFVNGALDLITSPRTFTHIGNGNYKTTLTLSTNQLSPGSGYVIIVKGEKHLARKFCKASGQTTACQSGEFITIPTPNGQTTTFTFTGLPLDPGDLRAQDGKADRADFAKIKDRMNISCSLLSDDDKLIADVNYSGCVDSMDAYWMRHTLETRYDEN